MLKDWMHGWSRFSLSGSFNQDQAARGGGSAGQ